MNGVAQVLLEGFSMLGSFGAADTAESHDIQYFEMFGNRGLYHQGWTAVTRHNIPWTTDPSPAFDDDVWELYGPDDWTQSHDLAAEQPAKLAELQRLWLIEAAKYNVLPLDDRRYERINPDLAGRPQLIVGTRQILYQGMRVTEATALNVKNKSHSITAQLTVPDSGAEGVIVAQGGQVGGWTFYAHDGRLKYCFNFFGIEHYITASDDPVPAGDHQVRVEFTYDGGGLAKGAPSRCTSTAHQRARDGSSDPSRWATPPTRASRSDATSAHRRHRTMGRVATSSTAPSPGCSSTSATTTTTTSSPPRNASTWPWPGVATDVRPTAHVRSGPDVTCRSESERMRCP